MKLKDLNSFFSVILIFCDIKYISAQLSDIPYCRTELGFRLPYDIYLLDTCARCYNYLPETAFKPNAKLSYTPLGMLNNLQTNATFFSNETSVISQTFISNSLIIKWIQCCTDANHCCVDSLQYYNKEYSKATDYSCPRTWDGWSCWKTEGKPNTYQELSCPKHIYWHQSVPPCRGYATKQCNSSGEWFSINGREWSNYSNCARDDIFVNRIKYSIVTNMTSILLLIPALIIFNHYKQLSSVSRIRLHKYLFASLLLHAISESLLKWHLLTETESPNQSNTLLVSIYCLSLSLLLRYFRSATYLWMFNEALFLHQLIKQAFTQPPIVPLIILAYSLPFVTTLLYVVMRSLTNTSMNSLAEISFEANAETFINNNVSEIPLFDNLKKDEVFADTSSSSDDKCWLLPSDQSWVEWIINAPNLAILVVNFIFLISMLREICIKASSTQNFCSTSTATTHSIVNRQNMIVLVRAALLLLPLYGLHYLFIVYRPNIETCWLSQLYHYLSLTLDGLQGCVVSIMFCFANKEIRSLLNRSLKRLKTSSRNANTFYLSEMIPSQQ